MKTKLVFGHFGRHQVDLFSLYREYLHGTHVTYAEVVFTVPSPQWLKSLMWRRLGWASDCRGY